MGRLIVNADDFGLTSGVNRAVAELHAAGVLTSTTLMARERATNEAIDIGLATRSLGVGCHVVLIDGTPVLPSREIPSLVDARTGRFPYSLGVFLTRLFSGQIQAAEIEAEAAAQIARLQSRGLRLTHVDSHKHAHMFPAVLRPVLRAARAAGIAAVRNPFEPVWAMRATPRGALVRRAEETVLRLFEPSLRRIIAEEGLATTDGTLAVVGTGSLDARTLRSILKQLPAGTWELVTHPGYADEDLKQIRTRLQGSRAVEMEALRAVKEFPEVELISYAALAKASAMAG
ncbi:MAG TPA: ChbG/HpnK family deacetylase [Terracidiphilus sp.]|nr:ChbG/HpnK family deacetylase [Terracidiphilus sp.]